MAVRRGEGFAVRRWLQLGAASAGMGAALWGLSIAGPQVDVARAETGGAAAESSASSESAAESDGTRSGGAGDESVGAESAGPNETADTGSAPGERAPDGDGDGDETAIEQSAPARSAGLSRRAERSRHAAAEAAPEADETEELDEPDESDEPALPAPSPGVNSAAAQNVSADASPVPSPTRSWQSPYQRWVAGSLDAWTHGSLGWIESLQTSDRTKEQLEASFYAIRRTFFNQAPTIDPVQISGVLDGPVTGSIRAHDPDGDRLIYVLTRGPKSGTVQVNSDGTFTYVPGADFDGVDAFRVTAIDIGFHTNLLEPLRPIGSNPVRSLINQGAVEFDFNYTTGAEYWTTERRDALRRAADALIQYFRVLKPVSLTYDVVGENDHGPLAGLASAGSDGISEAAGFWDTVVQDKLLTGRDANGADADGEITWNFAFGWGLGDTIAAGDYDFHSTALHELLHSFGFLSEIQEVGENTGRSWMILDSFVVTADRKRPIGRNLRWNSAFDDHLIGEDGGLYFSGRNAVAAYGGLVPLYYPSEWDPGSSAHHTDDLTFTGSEQLLMNAQTGTGLGVRVISAIEIGILRDLGYLMVPLSL